MRVITENVGKMRDVRIAYYSNPADLSANVIASPAAMQYHKNIGMGRDGWVGRSFDEFVKLSKSGDVSYARSAEKMVDKYANLALKDYARVLDYNLISGQLDYQAAYGGDPMCMYGQTIVETDVAPVHVYVDAWTSATVPHSAMERRGLAVLALTLALSVYRPVMTQIVTGLRHTPTRTNTIQVITVPTTPMDLSMASWMLGDPSFFRRGIMSMAHGIAKSGQACGLPALSDAQWQRNSMANWLAEREGVNEVVYLPMMFGAGEWDNDEFVQDWIKKQLARFVA